MRRLLLAPREWTGFARLYQIDGVKTIDEIRHGKLIELLADYPSIQSFADAIGRSHSQVSQWKNRSKRQSGGVASIDSDSARLIEQCTNRPRGWMDTYWPFVSIDPDRLDKIPPQTLGLIESAMVAEIKAHEARAANVKVA